MESIIVGIDVSKDRLDVALRPSGETFVVERNAEGLALLTQRLRSVWSQPESQKWSRSSQSPGSF